LCRFDSIPADYGAVYLEKKFDGELVKVCRGNKPEYAIIMLETLTNQFIVLQVSWIQLNLICKSIVEQRLDFYTIKNGENR